MEHLGGGVAKSNSTLPSLVIQVGFLPPQKKQKLHPGTQHWVPCLSSMLIFSGAPYNFPVIKHGWPWGIPSCSFDPGTDLWLNGRLTYVHEWLKFTLNVGKYTNAVVYFSHSLFFFMSVSAGRKTTNSLHATKHHVANCPLELPITSIAPSKSEESNGVRRTRTCEKCNHFACFKRYLRFFAN